MGSRIIGITGPVQHGKYQLEPVFRECGWEFLDLNEIVYRRRRKGTPLHNAIIRVHGNIIDNEGIETGLFYRKMDRSTYQSLLEEAIPHVISETQEVCAALPEGSRLILSWEYLARITHSLPLDRLLLFQSERSVWFERLRIRATELGWPGVPTDVTLDSVIQMLRVEPSEMLHEARSSGVPVETFDVTPDDWGATNLRQLLAVL